jgi:hypothetical protein
MTLSALKIMVRQEVSNNIGSSGGEKAGLKILAHMVEYIQ